MAMKPPPERLFAWVLEGEDSFIAILNPENKQWYPLVFSNETRALGVQERIKDIVKDAGKPAVLRSYKFEKIVGGVG